MSSSIGEHDRTILNAIFNPYLPIGESIYDGEFTQEIEDEDEEITPEVEAAKKLEVEGIKAAEAGNLVEAEKIYNKILKVAERASAYNNRAQVLRLRGNNEAAMADLNKAIEISDKKGKAGCQAYCQRGLLLRRCGRDAEAKEDFMKAADLGSDFAKQQLVEMNPYAAMCNQMLNDMMVKLKGIRCPDSV